MLLRFGLTNHTSFREACEASFIATSQRDEPSFRFSAPHAQHGVLPAIGVWGANASGKSNLLRALLHFRALVKSSFTAVGPGEPLEWSPFALRTADGSPPTQMDLDLLVDGQRFHYGFRFRASGIDEEWLYTWPKHRRQVLFHRDQRAENPWYFGPALGGQRQSIARATRGNSLFLSAAAQHNHEELSRVYLAIVDGIRSESRIELRGHPLFTADSPILDAALRPVVTAFLGAADVGIFDFRAQRREVSPENLGRIFHPEALRLAERVDGGAATFELHLRHGARDDGGWELPPHLESRGTHILLRRLEDLLLALRGGGVLVLDEIDTSLHPDLCGALIDAFTTPSSNPRQAQLVFSTHHGELLSRLRRDEVVIVDKARDGGSTLRTAADYADLRQRDDLVHAYAQGRLRGVPALGDLPSILARGLPHAS